MRFLKLRISVASRVAISLMLLSIVSYLLVAQVTGLRGTDVLRQERRTSLCEALAISCSLFAERREESRIRANLTSVLERNSDILSAGLNLGNGRYVAEVGDHRNQWIGGGRNQNEVFIPISRNGHVWGELELRFQDDTSGIGALARHPIIGIGAALFVLNLIFFRWYLGKILRYLNPTSAVPEHVRSTLDTFAEGVAVLDGHSQIILVNQAFLEQVENPLEELTGRSLDSLNWVFTNHETAPWLNLADQERRVGRHVKRVHTTSGSERHYLVNASPIIGVDGKRRGTVTSFDDVTAMEEKGEQLRGMLVDLQLSREELSKRNRELHVLATRDPLTGCLNRRTFFEEFHSGWEVAESKSIPLSCLMVDIDHFKSINDRFGHSTGDEVLRAVGRLLTASVTSPAIAARYGGEEFCILLPEAGLEEASRLGELLRQAIAALKFDQLSITTSIGVSCTVLGAKEPQELLDQADKCLYVAKRGGRNQVVRWDAVPIDLEIDEKMLTRHGEDVAIPYQAVTSLVSALAYRHPDTAAHSMRVAELAVLCSRGLMSSKDAYILEIGALLHDIGKIGVPDAILLKPGALTKDEWTVMRIHDRIGMEIVEASFANRKLIDIVRHHHATFIGNPTEPEMPTGQDIPLGARIVTIADAYDAMISDRVYRKGRPPVEAFAELRRCAGRQFDPNLVEHFIKAVEHYRPQTVNVASKYVALQIGLQLEKLTDAVDAHDFKAIKLLASRLEATASSSHIPEIREVAAKIGSASAELQLDSGSDDQESQLLKMTQELIDLCRSTQRAYSSVQLKEIEAFGLKAGNEISGSRAQ